MTKSAWPFGLAHFGPMAIPSKPFAINIKPRNLGKAVPADWDIHATVYCQSQQHRHTRGTFVFSNGRRSAICGVAGGVHSNARLQQSSHQDNLRLIGM